MSPKLYLAVPKYRTQKIQTINFELFFRSNRLSFCTVASGSFIVFAPFWTSDKRFSTKHWTSSASQIYFHRLIMHQHAARRKSRLALVGSRRFPRRKWTSNTLSLFSVFWWREWAWQKSTRAHSRRQRRCIDCGLAMCIMWLCVLECTKKKAIFCCWEHICARLKHMWIVGMFDCMSASNFAGKRDEVQLFVVSFTPHLELKC